jgi:hypothetical protein
MAKVLEIVYHNSDLGGDLEDLLFNIAESGVPTNDMTPGAAPIPGGLKRGGFSSTRIRIRHDFDGVSMYCRGAGNDE